MFREMGVHEYVRREEAEASLDGKIVAVRWVNKSKGAREKPKARCQRVA